MAIAVFILLAIFAVLFLADCRQWNGGQMIIEILDSADYYGFLLELATTKWAKSADRNLGGRRNATKAFFTHKIYK